MSEVNRILGKVDELAEQKRNEKFHLCGESVKVIDGPFNGFNGVLKKLMKRRKS